MVIAQRELAPAVFDLYLYAPETAEEAAAGQFVNLYCSDESHLLPRPVSLAGVDIERGLIRLVYRVAGYGTGWFSGLRKGNTVDLIGPLGNGFPLKKVRGKHVCLVGGGIGIPPLLETARELKNQDPEAQISAVLGYRDDKAFLAREFASFGAVYLASEDGSIGVRGTVLDVLRKSDGLMPGGCMFACGPASMLRALQQHAEKNEIPCWFSLEERMACGVGACLGCVCRTAEIDAHSHVRNRRVCKDGPVFPAKEVLL